MRMDQFDTKFRSLAAANAVTIYLELPCDDSGMMTCLVDYFDMYFMGGEL